MGYSFLLKASVGPEYDVPKVLGNFASDINQVNLTRCKTERRKTHTTSCNRRDKNKISLPVQYYERRLDFLSCDDFIKQILHPI